MEVNEKQTQFQKKEYKPLPTNDYKMRLVNFEIKENKAKTGLNGSAQFEIVGGEYGSAAGKKGRRVFHNFLVDHPNKDAVGYSNNRLNKFLAAVGCETTIEDMGFDYSKIMDEAGEIPFVGHVDINEYEVNGVTKVGNRITSFKKR